MTDAGWVRFDGLIAGAAFASGDQLVVGCWPVSPFGPFVDAMWARPDGSRVLVIEDGPQEAFVRSHYRFDEVITSEVGARVSSDGVVFVGGPVCLQIELAGPTILSAALGLRPRFVREREWWGRLEDVLFRPALAPVIGRGVRARGVTTAGTRERYVARDVRWATGVSASLDGRDLGPAAPPRRPAGFGFSEFLARPGAVRVTSLFEPRALVSR